MNLPGGRVVSSQKKILCLSGSQNKPEVFFMGHTAGGVNYMFDKENFHLNNPLPCQTLYELIKKGLRKQVFKKVNTGYMSLIRRTKNKSNSKLIENAAEVNDKKHWLHYLSFNQRNISEKYNIEQIMHCLNKQDVFCPIKEVLA